MLKNKIKVNTLLYILINIMLLVLGTDYITYFSNLDYIICLVISLMIMTPLNLLILKKIELKLNFAKEDIIFFGFLLLIMIMTIPFPDRSFDTMNYHLYLQEKPFGEKIFFDFFAGKNLNSFSYAFPDRLFYLFRYFLGYRLGVIFNYLIVTIIFYQVKELLNKINIGISKITLVTFSTIVVTTLSIIDIVDSYYVDLVSVVILLQIVMFVFDGKKLNKKDNNTLMYMFIGLLFGLAFSVKISNALLLIPLFIAYIIMHKNIFTSLKVKDIILTVLMFLLPFFVYLVYTYIETGNPVFPFYNTIFKSEYFGNWNWLDLRFGPKGIIETILWPFIIMISPARTADIAIAEPLWCYGYMVSTGYIIYYLYNIIRHKKFDKNRLIYFIFVILLYLFWSKFQLGYTRYGLIVLILGGISFCTFLYDSFKNKKTILITIGLVLMTYNIAYSSSNYLYRDQFWIYNNIANNEKANYIYNLENLFADGKQNVELDKDAVIGVFYYNAGLAQMINNSNLPIINFTSGIDNELTQNIFDQSIESKKIYTLVDALDFQNFINELNNLNYKIVSIKDVITSDIIGRENSFVYIFEVEKAEDGYQNKFLAFSKEYTIDTSNLSKISFWIGLTKDGNKAYNIPFNFKIYEESSKGRTELNMMKVSFAGSLEKISIELEKSSKHVIIEVTDDNGNLLDGAWLMLLNVEESIRR